MTTRRAGLVALAVLAADQLTKYWARTNLIGDPRVVIDGILSWEYAENTGAAFGILRGANAGVALSFAAVLAVGIVVYALPQTESKAEGYGLVLIGSGAVGNLIDRITNSDDFLAGFVVDWIRLPNFPNFNIADSAITVGAVMLVISAWRSRDR